ncbi:hypothetical protein [Mucilaginibacter agri]|uniref:TonB C-terminal domain-containing protein n=1 Tax=Mucilaginibacter agri TaxID=2695265 RepID=A0A965ZIA3_9SPHI|nr:hypothetical protein [Mucilaginibacter agri]NCD71550.1 hypothetical protein [Mucilaginibacter agri]
MNKLFLILVFIILTFSVQLTIAQSGQRVEAHLVENDTLAKYISKTFTRVTKQKSTDLCVSSTVFAQFIINAKGDITNVEFIEYDKRYPVFKEILSELITATKGLWVPAKENGLSVESKKFILPLIFEMEAGCPVGSRHPFNQSNQAFINLFSQKGVKAQIDCVLLAPYYMTSSVD